MERKGSIADDDRPNNNLSEDDIRPIKDFFVLVLLQSLIDEEQ